MASYHKKPLKKQHLVIRLCENSMKFSAKYLNEMVKFVRIVNIFIKSLVGSKLVKKVILAGSVQDNQFKFQLQLWNLALMNLFNEDR